MNEKEKYLPRERILSTVSSRYHRAMKITFHLSPTSVLYRHLRGRNEIKCRDATRILRPFKPSPLLSSNEIS